VILALSTPAITSSTMNELVDLFPQSPRHGLASCPSVSAAAEILNEASANTIANSSTELGS
jgi:hypothetical protein